MDTTGVEHIARLSRLSLTDEEKGVFGSQLRNILDYINKLNELDISSVEPTSHVVELTNVVRKDAIKPSLSVDEALGNAPDRADGFYRVPRIIE
jgi:aspartyl-tRNA(Asn)/glutamyl-tRNA(Gln) amidotransferase subunit C